MIWIILWCLVIGVVVWILFLVVVVGLTVHHTTKLILGLPRLTWLTLDEVVARGYSRFWCIVLLPQFYKDGYIEVRLAGLFEETFLEDTSMPEEMREALQDAIDLIKRQLHENKETFNSQTIEFHEFRLIKGGGRRRLKFKSLLKPLSAWQSAPV